MNSVFLYNKNTIKMLAKYNLYVGDKIEKDEKSFSVESYGDDYLAYTAAESRCDTLREIYGDENVETTAKYTTDGVPTEYFCRIYTRLEYEKVKQNKLAIGLYPTGNMEVAYPIYGSVYLDLEVGDKEFDENFDIIPETGDNIIIYIFSTIISLIGLVFSVFYIKTN